MVSKKRELAALAREMGVVAVTGTQARVTPAMLHVRELVKSDDVGEVLSTTLVGSSVNWGQRSASLTPYAGCKDRSRHAVNPVRPHDGSDRGRFGRRRVGSAVLATRRKTVRLNESGEDIPMTAADQVLVSGLLTSGAPISAHHRGGLPPGTGLLWEINGTDGDIQMSGSSGHKQSADLQVKGARGDDEALADLPLPDALRDRHDLDLYADNVARLYQQLESDIRDGTHRLIAALEPAASNGRRVTIDNV